MPPRLKKNSVFAALTGILRRFLGRQERRPFFAGKFLSNGSKVIQTARSQPQRRQKVKPRQRMIVAKKQKIRAALSLSIKTLLSAAAAGALIVHVARFVLNSPAFALEHVGVSGNTNLTAQAVIRQSGLVEGQNMFKTAVADVAAAIEELPRVHSAIVSRQLPDQIRIVVRERQPVAMVLAKELLLIDRDRKILDRYNPAEQMDAPIITGRALSSVSVGDAVETEGIFQALQVIEIMSELNLPESVRISEINIDNPENLLMVAEPSGATIYLGAGEYRDKIWRLAQVADEIQRNERFRVAVLERVDMRFESIIPARFSGS